MTSAEAISPQLRIFGAAVLLVFVGWVVRLVRTERLTLRDSLLWLLSTSVALVTIAFPELLFETAQGIENKRQRVMRWFCVVLVLSLLSGCSVFSSSPADSWRRRRWRSGCPMRK